MSALTLNPFPSRRKGALPSGRGTLSALLPNECSIDANLYGLKRFLLPLSLWERGLGGEGYLPATRQETPCPY